MGATRESRRPTPVRTDLPARFRRVRAFTVELVEPLSAEDMAVQVAAEASPTKWQLGHTTWFFETFVLEPFERGFTPYAPEFRVLFNSYYRGVGPQHPRPSRGALTRPGVGEVFAYRDTIDERICALLDNAPNDDLPEIARRIELGCQHEQQHQELILTDLMLLLHANPLQPAYHEDAAGSPAADPGAMQWIDCGGGLVEIGHDGPGFAHDHESPRHKRWLEPHQLASRLVTNAEYLAFVEDGGYEDPAHWLDDGWATRTRSDWRAPLYWSRDDDGNWTEFTLAGRLPLDPHRPVGHLSFYEADAFAKWAGARLPTEAEWEHAATSEHARDADGAFADDREFRARPTAPGAPLAQLFGDLWEWTRSAHEPYPGYSAEPGPIGEYNGKFMCNQFVLRGGACATSRDHIRPTYRNFFHPDTRRQFAGVRLARGIRG